MRNTWILGRGRPESQEGETKAANGRAHDISETISHLYATVSFWGREHPPRQGGETIADNGRTHEIGETHRIYMRK